MTTKNKVKSAYIDAARNIVEAWVNRMLDPTDVIEDVVEAIPTVYTLTGLDRPLLVLTANSPYGCIRTAGFATRMLRYICGLDSKANWDIIKYLTPSLAQNEVDALIYKRTVEQMEAAIGDLLFVPEFRSSTEFRSLRIRLNSPIATDIHHLVWKKLLGDPHRDLRQQINDEDWAKAKRHVWTPLNHQVRDLFYRPILEAAREDITNTPGAFMMNECIDGINNVGISPIHLPYVAHQTTLVNIYNGTPTTTDELAALLTTGTSATWWSDTICCVARKPVISTRWKGLSRYLTNVQFADGYSLQYSPANTRVI